MTERRHAYKKEIKESPAKLGIGKELKLKTIISNSQSSVLNCVSLPTTSVQHKQQQLPL